MTLRTTIYCTDMIESKLKALLAAAECDPVSWSAKTGKGAPKNTNQLISTLIEIGFDIIEDQLPKALLMEQRPVWETVAAIGISLPEESWEDVPVDLSKNLDYYLYGGLPNKGTPTDA